MDLYNLKKEKLTRISSESFDLEKDMQSLIENNVDALFDLEFISTEFEVGEFRIDTLCYDNGNNNFVIIEYKKGSSYSVIDQGYSYMAVLLNNKSDFVLEYIEKTGRKMKKNEVDWSQSKIIFVSPSFNSYQKNSVNFRDVPFELWEIKKFAENIISLNQHLSSSKESIIKIEKHADSVISTVAKEVGGFEEKDHTLKSDQSIVKTWEILKEKFSELEGVEIVPKRPYISLMYLVRNLTIAYFTFKKDRILVTVLRGNIRVDGSKSQYYFDFDDPKGITKERFWVWKDGSRGTVYDLTFGVNSDMEYFVFLIKQKYRNVVNR